MSHFFLFYISLLSNTTDTNYQLSKNINRLKKILNIYIVAIRKRDFYFLFYYYFLFGGEIHPFGIHLYENLYKRSV